jgi:acetyltransferase EpsM
MILYGASGHAKVIMEILEACGDTVTALWDDAEKPAMRGLQVQQPQLSDTVAGTAMIISVGNNRIRKKIAARLEGLFLFEQAIHPRSIVSGTAATGEGTVIMAGATINADSSIGRHCIINTNAVVDHDCVLEDYVHISPNATLCGNVTVGEGTHIGAGATVIQGVRIGSWCTIGAGAVVIRDIPDGVTAVGNPTYILNKVNQES